VINRTQALVLVFLAAALLALAVIMVIAPGIIESKLPAPSAFALPSHVLLLSALTVLVLLLAVGIRRRWRWLFWLLAIAFLFGFLRIPASMLQLARILPATDPAWYVVVQALVGAVQLGIGLLMLRGYRRSGPWGPF
jgi:hypothetical protein